LEVQGRRNIGGEKFNLAVEAEEDEERRLTRKHEYQPNPFLSLKDKFKTQSVFFLLKLDIPRKIQNSNYCKDYSKLREKKDFFPKLFSQKSFRFVKPSALWLFQEGVLAS